MSVTARWSGVHPTALCREHRAGLERPQETCDFDPGFHRILNQPILERQHRPFHTKDIGGLHGLVVPNASGRVPCRFAFTKIDEQDGLPAAGELRRSATHDDFEIVWMRPERHDIESLRLQAIAHVATFWSRDSSRSRHVTTYSEGARLSASSNRRTLSRARARTGSGKGAVPTSRHSPIVWRRPWTSSAQRGHPAQCRSIAAHSTPSSSPSRYAEMLARSAVQSGLEGSVIRSPSGAAT